MSKIKALEKKKETESKIDLPFTKMAKKFPHPQLILIYPGRLYTLTEGR